MTILFHNTTFDKIDVWKKTIKKYFKNEKIISIKDYKNFNDVNCAIIWNLPDNILSRLKNLQVIFSMGAGVDHILKLKNYNKKKVLKHIYKNRVALINHIFNLKNDLQSIVEKKYPVIKKLLKDILNTKVLMYLTKIN